MGVFMNVRILDKKGLVFAVLLVFGICLVIPPASAQMSPDLPPWLNESPPEDVIWGIGVAKLSNNRNSAALAELRARSGLVNQLGSEVSYLYRDDDPVFDNLYMYFMSQVSTDFSFELMHETRVVRGWTAPDGTYWCLVEMRKADALKYAGAYSYYVREQHGYILME